MAAIDLSLRIRQFTEDLRGIKEGLNRELVPVLRRVLGEVNLLGGATVVTDESTYDARRQDGVIIASAAGGATVNLPDPSDVADKHMTVIRSGGAGAVTVADSAGGTISGAASKTISTAWGTLRLFSDGTAWYVTASG